MSRFRWLTAGESHGPRLVTIVEGLPAGLALSADDINRDLARRQVGYGRGGRQKIERDAVAILSGVRGGATLGSPVALSVENRDFENWRDKMGAEPFAAAPEPLTRPRPGHADLAGGLKYDRHDLRDVLERASARETAARTAAGAVARTLLQALGIEVSAWVEAIGDVTAKAEGSLADISARALASELACPDTEAEARMRAAILEASHAGDTLGGSFVVVARGVPAGLGSHVHWDRKLDGRLAQALMSIQAIKAVAIGDGASVATKRGSEVHDPIAYDETKRRFVRGSNHAGGLEGGVTNGEVLVARASMKPIATLRRALASVDVVTKEPFDAAFERSDICAVAAASVVGEAMVCLVLAEAVLEKFGGDSMGELRRNFTGYLAQLTEY
ncbi:MAG: chorismate synthase [Myxococcales bacterium]|nr:chorismate synthase [Myxococcales bacterium]